MRHRPLVRRLRYSHTGLPEASVSEKGRVRSLHLSSDTIQSAMNLDAPNELVLSYSRAMMLWPLFHPNARHITQIGLGGGAFSRWIEAYFPTKQLVIEINPQVILIAKSQFGLPAESSEFVIQEGDGADIKRYVAQHTESGQTDIIMVDGFDGQQIVDALVSPQFFHDCRESLSENGVFVTNWWSKDKRYGAFLQALLAEFEGRVLEVPAQSHGNMAVYAFKNTPSLHRWSAMAEAAKAAQEHYHIEFTELLNAAQKHYPIKSKGLDW